MKRKCSICGKRKTTHKNGTTGKQVCLKCHKDAHVAECLVCKQHKKICARGLCSACYQNSAIGTCLECDEETVIQALGLCRGCYKRFNREQKSH